MVGDILEPSSERSEDLTVLLKERTSRHSSSQSIPGSFGHHWNYDVSHYPVQSHCLRAQFHDLFSMLGHS